MRKCSAKANEELRESCGYRGLCPAQCCTYVYDQEYFLKKGIITAWLILFSLYMVVDMTGSVMPWKDY